MEQTQQKKWYDNKIVVGLLCFLLFPVGLYALWKSRTINQTWKVVWTIAVAIFIYVTYPDSNEDSLTASASETPALNESEPAPEELIIPEGFSYRIIQEEPNKRINKNSIDIRLTHKVDEAVIKSIAESLRNEDRDHYEKLYIAYYLPDMVVDAGAWATSHFTPNLEVKILGSTAAEDDVMLKTDDVPGEISSKWRLEAGYGTSTMFLYKNKQGNLMMRVAFKDGSSMDEELTEKKVGNKTRYDYDNGHGEYYMLESNGNLGLYGKDGKFDEAKKI